MTQEDAIVFLNRNGRAYDMWKHMMRAGEEYIKQTLQRESPARFPTEYRKRTALDDRVSPHTPPPGGKGRIPTENPLRSLSHYLQAWGPSFALGPCAPSRCSQDDS